MPIYEYQCEACHHELEEWQKLSDPPLKECPACGEMTLKKLISASGFRLKGGGWYETDFKSSDRKNIAGDKAAKKTGSKDNKSESKPAGNAASKSKQSGKTA